MPKRKREIPGQLPMFMSAREIMGSYKPDVREDPSRTKSSEELMAGKLAAAKAGERGEGFEKSVTEEGVRVPVHLSLQFREIGEGHHRLAVAMQADPDRLMPVVHHESMEQLGAHFSESDYGIWDEERDW